MTKTAKAWAARILVAAVFAMNVSCALQFICCPGTFVGAYSLQGAGAPAAIQGFGVCFLMWNATYPPLIANPHKHLVLFAVVLAQQAIGLAGEAFIRQGVEQSLALYASIGRFMAFDAMGLVALAAAFLLALQASRADS